MFSFINDMGNYEARKVGRDTVEGLDISTCDTTDEGYETALLDANGAHPVERYSSLEAAKEGHEKWKTWAANRTNTRVVKLGWLDGLCDAEEIELVRQD